MSFSVLPNEVILNILKRLPLQELLHAACVCQRWNSLAFEVIEKKIRVRELMLHYVNFSDEDFERLVQILCSFLPGVVDFVTLKLYNFPSERSIYLVSKLVPICRKFEKLMIDIEGRNGKPRLKCVKFKLISPSIPSKLMRILCDVRPNWMKIMEAFAPKIPIAEIELKYYEMTDTEYTAYLSDIEVLLNYSDSILAINMFNFDRVRRLELLKKLSCHGQKIECLQMMENQGIIDEKYNCQDEELQVIKASMPALKHLRYTSDTIEGSDVLFGLKRLTLCVVSQPKSIRTTTEPESEVRRGTGIHSSELSYVNYLRQSCPLYPPLSEGFYAFVVFNKPIMSEELWNSMTAFGESVDP